MIKTVANVKYSLDKDVMKAALVEGYKYLLVHVKKNPICYDYIFYKASRDFNDAIDALNDTGDGLDYYAMNVAAMV